MNLPSNLKYTKEHEWLLDEGNGKVSIGVTAYAVEQLGDIVHIEFPQVGDSLGAGAPFGTIESTKTVSDLYSPVSGKVVAVNADLKNQLDVLATDPYTSNWIIKLEVSSPAELNELLSAEAYQAFIAE